MNHTTIGFFVPKNQAWIPHSKRTVLTAILLSKSAYERQAPNIPFVLCEGLKYGKPHKIELYASSLTELVRRAHEKNFVEVNEAGEFKG